jgi:hypothetical protein
MSEEIRKQINMFENFEFSLNKDEEKFAFDDLIKYELKRYLEGTILGKLGKTDERATQLMDIHKNFIRVVKNKMSAEEIAKRLFMYEKNNL